MKIIPIKAVGGCSKTSKMPCMSYGLPTAECITGSKLAKKEGTVCSKCYANKGHYAMFRKNIQPIQYRRFEAMKRGDWVENMVKVLDNERWFRWFDSGDLPSTLMLSKIVDVARQTPWCNHWLATRERRFIHDWLKNHPEGFPDNLSIRISATYPDVPAKPVHGCGVGNVHSKKRPSGYECPAPSQGGKCDTCRACWDKSVPAVSYKEH